MLGAFTDLNEASSLTYANDMIDIYSNSWGPCDDGCVDGPMRLTELALRTGAERVRAMYCAVPISVLTSLVTLNYTYTHACTGIQIACMCGVVLTRYNNSQLQMGDVLR